jgi:hypothetical protein
MAVEPIMKVGGSCTGGPERDRCPFRSSDPGWSRSRPWSEEKRAPGAYHQSCQRHGSALPQDGEQKNVDIQIEPERLWHAAALDLIICRDWSGALNQTSTEVSVLPRWVESPGPVIAGGMTAGPVAARENRSLTSAGIHKCRSWVAAAAEER